MLGVFFSHLPPYLLKQGPLMNPEPIALARQLASEILVSTSLVRRLYMGKLPEPSALFLIVSVGIQLLLNGKRFIQ